MHWSMLIRGHDRQWSVSWWRAMHALGLDGTGALRPHRIKGTLRIERGGVCLNAYRAVR
jgi:hypothetical protein